MNTHQDHQAVPTGKAAAERYVVREVRGIGLGAGGFEVVDTEDGSAWGMTLWRDEAERRAALWNAADLATASTA